jgi:hypothetical protein
MGTLLYGVLYHTQSCRLALATCFCVSYLKHGIHRFTDAVCPATGLEAVLLLLLIWEIPDLRDLRHVSGVEVLL